MQCIGKTPDTIIRYLPSILPLTCLGCSDSLGLSSHVVLLDSCPVHAVALRRPLPRHSPKAVPAFVMGFLR